MKYTALPLLAISLLAGCSKPRTNEEAAPAKGTYGYDQAFLLAHVGTIELKKGDAAVLLVPQYEGRVMTSTCAGPSGKSFGWVNYSLIDSGKLQEHMNAYGGEERLWLGPEGGQYSVFFKAGVPFNVENWFTPRAFDSEPFDVVQQSADSAVFHKSFVLTNRAGSTFHIGIRRSVRILDRDEISKLLGVPLDSSVHAVAYQSRNTLINEGPEPWTKASGLLSVWMLGQFSPSTNVKIVLPIRKGSEQELGRQVKADYFGQIPTDRLSVTDSVIYFKADGQQRGKVGISPKRARGFIGSYDSDSNILTLLKSTVESPDAPYVNSMWEEQKQPFAGDAFNAYNDGPLDDGSQLGPFFELEASSPAAILAPGDSLTHVQTTFHLVGDKTLISNIASKDLGVDTETISHGLK